MSGVVPGEGSLCTLTGPSGPQNPEITSVSSVTSVEVLLVSSRVDSVVSRWQKSQMAYSGRVKSPLILYKEDFIFCVEIFQPP